MRTPHTLLALGVGAAGVAVVVGVLERLAAALVALQIWMFLALVWLPVLAKGNISPGNWAELLTTWVIGSGAWVVADSYREMSWLAVKRQRGSGTLASTAWARACR